MATEFKQLILENHGNVTAVSLRQSRVAPEKLDELLGDLENLVDGAPSNKIALRLGPEDPECLYSVFLAKLVTVQKRLAKSGGLLAIVEASPTVQSIFDACKLRAMFDFKPDLASAVASLEQSP
jgi:hypothetical protein